MMKHFLLFCSVCALTTPALAEPFTYGPDNCEFQITFPEKPFIEKKCASDGKDCTEVVSFTKAVGAESSLNFRVTCNPITTAESEKYTPAIIEETLKQMMKAANFQPYNIQSGEDHGYKSATSLSISERDQKGVIYNGQIWAGKSSLFTMEAEMVGAKNTEIEKTFATILMHTYPKDQPPKPKVDAKKDASKSTTKP